MDPYGTIFSTDNILEGDALFPKQAVLQILRVMQIILENCHNKSSFNGLEDDDEADTVGCCTLKVENCVPKSPNILKFDFLGKDSIRYQNEVEVVLHVFKAIQQFRDGKEPGDDLFDQLDTSKLNTHLKELMSGLTTKVFRTYNASITLDEMLSRETKGGDVAEKVLGLSACK